MRYYNVSLFIVLVAISFSNAFEFTSLAEVKQLRSSNYGNSLIETISLTLQNNGNVENVQTLLTDLFTKLVNDQRQSDVDWSKEEDRLKSVISDLSTEIESLMHDIAVDRSDKKNFEEKRDQAEKNLEQFKEQLAANGIALAKNEKNRNSDHAEYEKSVTEHGDVINAIEKVVGELKQLRGSISGSAKPNHVEEISQEKRDTQALSTSFLQISEDQVDATMFAELATSADQDELEKLIQILVSLSDSTKKSLEDDQVHEDKSRGTYEILKETLDKDNDRLLKNINDQTANLDDYKEKVSKLIIRITQEENLSDSKEKEKAATLKEKEEKEANYNSDRAERKNEMETITKLQTIVKERLAKMSDFLKSTVN